jgi:hypothetical protein
MSGRPLNLRRRNVTTMNRRRFKVTSRSIHYAVRRPTYSNASVGKYTPSRSHYSRNGKQQMSMGRIMNRVSNRIAKPIVVPKTSPVKADGKPMTPEECWSKFIDDTSFQVINYLPLNRIPKSSQFAAVIVEPRKHPHLEYIIRNTLYFLEAGWALHIFCGTQNEDYVRDIASRLPGHVHVHKLEKDNLSLGDYNLLLTSKDFWNQIESEKIIIFQTDVLLRHKGMHRLLSHSSNPGYIGSPWPGGRVGNGGFSFRQKSLMLQVIDTVPYQQVWPEDIYFSLAIHTHFPNRMASTQLASYFGMETQWSETSIGAHKIYNYHDLDKIHKFVTSIQYPFRTKWR